MPNHITNRITSDRAETLAAIKGAFRGEGKQIVDFHRVVPMPDDVLETAGKDLPYPTPAHLVGRNWYDWSCEHWGTKWNAYEIVDAEDALRFDTAWACPEPVVRRLAEIVTGSWRWDYANEDIGRDCGSWICADGRLTHQDPADPCRFACEVKGLDYEEYMAEQEA